MGGVSPWGGGRVGHGPLRTCLSPVPRRQRAPHRPACVAREHPVARPASRMGSATQDQCRISAESSAGSVPDQCRI